MPSERHKTVHHPGSAGTPMPHLREQYQFADIPHRDGPFVPFYMVPEPVFRAFVVLSKVADSLMQTVAQTQEQRQWFEAYGPRLPDGTVDRERCEFLDNIVGDTVTVEAQQMRALMAAAMVATYARLNPQLVRFEEPGPQEGTGEGSDDPWFPDEHG